MIRMQEVKSQPNRRTLWIIIGIVALNSIGMSIVLPLLPFLINRYLPADQVALGMSALLSVFAACTFLAAPILGALSDRYGRKRILLISLLGSVSGYVLFAIGGALWMLFLGRIIDGLTAGNVSTLFAYISDSTDPKERTKWFGYMGSAMGIGKLGGPALGGLLGSINIALPFYITATLILVSALAVYCLLPESLPVHKRTQELTIQSFNVFSHFKDIFTLKAVGALLIPGILFYVSLGIFQFNFTVFLKDVYEWGPAFIGTLLTLVGICDIISRIFLLPWLLKHFSERTVGFSGLLGLTLGLGLIVTSLYVTSVTLITLAVIFLITGEGLFDPTYNGILSQSVDERSQGKLQGVNQGLQSANNMLIPLVAGAIYFYSPSVLYGAAALISLLAAILFAKQSFRPSV